MTEQSEAKESGTKTKVYFGTDGIRGTANAFPLEPFFLVRLGRAIAERFKGEQGHRQRILIGKDTRLSGYMIETSIAAGITAQGGTVMLVGPLPTAGVAYLTKSMRADAGVMISASHNSFDDNGIKLFGSDGYKLPDAVELELENLIDRFNGVAEGVASAEVGKAQRIDDAVGRYTVFLKSCFPRELTLEGMRIGVDCANGAAYVVAPQTFAELGAEVVVRGASPNGRNINAGFGSLYPEVMSELILEQNLDIGVSLDGDADRAILVDEKGRVLDGDAVLAICALDLKQRGMLPGDAVVSTVMSNLGLSRFLSENKIALHRTAVGDRYVLEEMLERNVILGGEQSGHTIFSQYSTAGDGILTALMVLSIMGRSGKRLSELVGGFQKYPQSLVNVEVATKPDLESIDPIRVVIESKERELGNAGRILVRYSGTENKARVMVECEDEVTCNQHAREVAEVIEREIGGSV